jgi:hypothetical protein
MRAEFLRRELQQLVLCVWAHYFHGVQRAVADSVPVVAKRIKSLTLASWFPAAPDYAIWQRTPFQLPSGPGKAVSAMRVSPDVSSTQFRDQLHKSGLLATSAWSCACELISRTSLLTAKEPPLMPHIAVDVIASSRRQISLFIVSLFCHMCRRSERRILLPCHRDYRPSCQALTGNVLWMRPRVAGLAASCNWRSWLILCGLWPRRL